MLKTRDMLTDERGVIDWQALFAMFAYRMARRCLPAYSCEFSPQRFTQPQLLACLALKGRLGNSYRSVADGLAMNAKAREVLELDNVPHYSTLQRFERRLAGTCMPARIRSKANHALIRFGRMRRARQKQVSRTTHQPVPSSYAAAFI